jgi:putative DNA primase/helicase
MNHSTKETPGQNPSDSSNGRPKKSKGDQPRRFEVDECGLYHLTELRTKEDEDPRWERQWISAPITALGLASDQYGKGSSIVVEFMDRHGRIKTPVLPWSTFATRSGELVVRQLLDEGLSLSSAASAPKLVRQYLMQCHPSLRYLLAHKPGWYERVFALPDCAFGTQGENRILFQTHPASQQLLRAHGTFEDWLAAIGTHARGNGRLMFGISAAFAAPLLHLTGEESGVFHITCSSSKGKSTLLMVAGSVCGGGGPLGFARSWLMTANAVETTCESCNDLLLPLDELKLLDPKVAGRVAYMIASGAGKGRSAWTQNSTIAAPTASWRTLGLSSGEISLQTHVEAAAESLYGGQLVRFCEIPAIADPELGIFDRIPNGFSGPAEFAEKLKLATARCYGPPLRRYLDAVTADPDRHAREAADIISTFAAEVTPPAAASEIHRTARRFGLVVAGGIAATKDGCTDWDCDDVWDSQASIFRSWIANRGSLAAADEERAVHHVRSLIETNLVRFVDLTSDEPQEVRDQLGYRKIDISSDLTLFLVWPEAWAKVFCKGLDPRFVLKTLRNRGYLVTGKDRLEYQTRIPGFEQQKRFYAINERILQSAETEEVGAVGTEGTVVTSYGDND